MVSMLNKIEATYASGGEEMRLAKFKKKSLGTASIDLL
jgi:hypothetical protein